MMVAEADTGHREGEEPELMLVISGYQYTLTKRFYVWFAVVLLFLGIGPVVLLTMVATLKRTGGIALPNQNTPPREPAG